jgi:hypothetical protein
MNLRLERVIVTPRAGLIVLIRKATQSKILDFWHVKLHCWASGS